MVVSVCPCEGQEDDFVCGLGLASKAETLSIVSKPQEAAVAPYLHPTPGPLRILSWVAYNSLRCAKF